MASTSKLVELSLLELGQRIARDGAERSGKSTSGFPGGGAVAASLGLLGAGLLSMAFRAARDEDALADAADDPASAYQVGRARELDRLRERFGELADEDAGAYARFLSAKGDQDADPETRRASVQKALLEAIEVPLETMESAVAALRLAAVGTPQVKAALRSECIVGASSLFAALESGAAIVRDNLTSLSDAKAVEDRVAALETLSQEGAERLAEVRRAAGSEG